MSPPDLIEACTMHDAAPHVLYLTSRGHSGSTLLSLLLGGHSHVMSAGELKMLVNPDPQRRLCSCHRLVPDQCPFWSQVQSRVQADVGLTLNQLALIDHGDDIAFARDNRALFAAIAQVSGCKVIVDSSKSLPRLSRLLDVVEKSSDPGFALFPIHLHRGPFGSMNSALKKGDDLRQAAYNYCRLFFLTRERLRRIPHLKVYYERLATDPRQEIARVMAWLCLPVETAQFQWRDGVRRDIHGNDMRFDNSDQIRLDQGWRQQLTALQKLEVMSWTFPVRLRSRWLFRQFRLWIKPGVSPFP